MSAPQQDGKLITEHLPPEVKRFPPSRDSWLTSRVQGRRQQMGPAAGQVQPGERVPARRRHRGAGGLRHDPGGGAAALLQRRHGALQNRWEPGAEPPGGRGVTQGGEGGRGLSPYAEVENCACLTPDRHLNQL